MVRLSHDLNANAIYIELSERKSARTAEIDTGTLVDLDDSGQLVGIEVIDPARAWPLDEILKQHDLDPDDIRQLRSIYEELSQRLPRSSMIFQPVPA